jgi:hypothetical protein
MEGAGLRGGEEAVATLTGVAVEDVGVLVDCTAVGGTAVPVEVGVRVVVKLASAVDVWV